MSEQTETKTEGETLYAGKYKTVQELEEGYKQSLPLYQENETLKKQMAEVTKVPDEYVTPTDIALHEADLAEVKRLAKNTNLTQAQYEKLARETNAKSAARHEAFENAKKELGADKLNLLQDYISKRYPAGKIADAALRTIIMDKDAQAAALADRQAMLNNSVPGMGHVFSGTTTRVTQDDIFKAHAEVSKTRGKAQIAAKSKYLNLLKAKTQQEGAR